MDLCVAVAWETSFRGVFSPYGPRGHSTRVDGYPRARAGP